MSGICADGSGRCTITGEACELFVKPHTVPGQFLYFCRRTGRPIVSDDKGPAVIDDLDARALKRAVPERPISAEELCGSFDVLGTDNGAVTEAVTAFFQKLYLNARALVHDTPGAADEEKNEMALRMAKRALRRNLALAERKATGEA